MPFYLTPPCGTSRATAGSARRPRRRRGPRRPLGKGKSRGRRARPCGRMRTRAGSPRAHGGLTPRPRRSPRPSAQCAVPTVPWRGGTWRSAGGGASRCPAPARWRGGSRRRSSARAARACARRGAPWRTWRRRAGSVLRRRTCRSSRDASSQGGTSRSQTANGETADSAGVGVGRRRRFGDFCWTGPGQVVRTAGMVSMW